MAKKRKIPKLKTGDYLDTDNYGMGEAYDSYDDSNAVPGEADDAMDDGVNYMDAGASDDAQDYQDADQSAPSSAPYSSANLAQNGTTVQAFQGLQKKQQDALQLLKDAQARAVASLQPAPDKSAMWLSVAQGLLSPTRTGGFAESLGNAAGNAAPYEQHYADADSANKQGIATMDYNMAQQLYKDATKAPQIIDWYARNGAGAVGRQKALMVDGQPVPFGEVYAPGKTTMDQGAALKAKVDAYNNLSPDEKAAYDAMHPKPAGTNVNVNSGGQFEKESQKKAADRLDDLFKQADTSRQLAVQLNAVAPYLEKTPNAYFGPGGAGLVALGKGLKQIGFDVGDGLDNASFVQSIMSHLGPAQRIQGSGSSSDRDVKLFMDSLPGLSQTKDGNRMLIKYYNKLNDYNQKLVRIIRSYSKDHPDFYGIEDLPTEEINKAGRVFSDADLSEMQALAAGKSDNPHGAVQTVNQKVNDDGTITLTPGSN